MTDTDGPKTGMNYSDGMPLRDYFAAAALQGMMAFHGSYGAGNGTGDVATRAYEAADAMLAARAALTTQGGDHG